MYKVIIAILLTSTMAIAAPKKDQEKVPQTPDDHITIQYQCVPSADIVKNLQKGQFSMSFIGKSDQGYVFVFINKSNGQWVAVIQPMQLVEKHISCVLTDGNEFMMPPTPEPNEKTPEIDN